MTFRTTGMHHFGVVVSDLERSVRFYEDVFGARKEWEMEASGEAVSALTRVPGSDVRIAFLRLPNAGLELFEYRRPPGRPYPLQPNDVGRSHLCLEVDDIDAAYARLQELDVECHFPPQRIDEGVLAGLRFFDFSDPDGVPIEIYQTRPGA